MKRKLLALMSCLLLATAVACGGDDENNGNNGNNGGNNGADAGDTNGGDGGDGGEELMQYEGFDDDCTTTVGPQSTAELTVRGFNQAFLDVAEGGVVCMVDGDYMLDGQLTLNTGSGIELRGQSQANTVLDFSMQSDSDEGSGANGILVEGVDDFKATEFTIKNTAGDALKVQDADGVEMINLTVDWDAGRDPNNGAYGLYPVLSQNVLVEGCTARHASDAGIYLGQSDTAILRNNTAEKNVAGIEIENTINAEVHGNTATDNTGGILIFNLPGLTMYGDSNKIHTNTVTANNGENFASGGIVSNVPPGTGIFILAMDGNELHNNTITDNDTMGIAILDYEGAIASLEGASDDENYDTYAEANYVHDNTLENNGTNPQGLLPNAIVAGQPPHDAAEAPYAQVWVDWFVDTEKESPYSDRINCFMDNVDENDDPVTFDVYGLSLGGDPPTFPEPATDCNTDDWTDPCHFQCEGTELTNVTLP
jgi:parallel beta-helix repeat protein